MRFRGRSQCNCGSGIRGAATCNAPTCNVRARARARVCMCVRIRPYPRSDTELRRVTCTRVFLRAFSRRCARNGSGKHRGQDARRRCVPNFTAEKLDAASLRSLPPGYARRFEMQIAQRRRRVTTWKLLPPPPPGPRGGEKYWKQRRETWKKNPRGRGGSDPRGNISRITSARFVGEILITFPRHRGGKVCV